MVINDRVRSVKNEIYSLNRTRVWLYRFSVCGEYSVPTHLCAAPFTYTSYCTVFFFFFCLHLIFLSSILFSDAHKHEQAHTHAGGCGLRYATLCSAQAGAPTW